MILYSTYSLLVAGMTTVYWEYVGNMWRYCSDLTDVVQKTQGALVEGMISGVVSEGSGNTENVAVVRIRISVRNLIVPSSSY